MIYMSGGNVESATVIKQRWKNRQGEGEGEGEGEKK